MDLTSFLAGDLRSLSPIRPPTPCLAFNPRLKFLISLDFETQPAEMWLAPNLKDGVIKPRKKVSIMASTASKSKNR
jgi:hypothetical protein